MSEHAPIASHVARWSEDEWSRGSWSFLRPGGSPRDRAALAQPVSDRVILAGEAVHAEQAGMVHGAWETGVAAAQWCASVGGPRERVAVIGAGMAGLAAARTLADRGRDVVVFEARDRIGGRIHTVDLGGVLADAGGAWLQQAHRNPLVDHARALGLRLVPTDFTAPLSAADDGPVGDVDGALARLLAIARADQDETSLAAKLNPYLAGLGAGERRLTRFAIEAEIVLEAGVGTDELSAAWALREPGTGDGDQWIVEGYGALAADAARDLDIRLGTAIESVEHDDRSVTLSATAAQIERADRCVCSVPVSLVAAGLPHFDPPLPATHQLALSHVGMGRVEKVLMRFEHRWWPASPSGYLRWYEREPSWGEWLDLTGGCGEPVVAGLIAGPAIDRWHRGRSDEEVVGLATEALARWAAAVTRERG